MVNEANQRTSNGDRVICQVLGGSTILESGGTPRRGKDDYLVIAAHFKKSSKTEDDVQVGKNISPLPANLDFLIKLSNFC